MSDNNITPAPTKPVFARAIIGGKKTEKLEARCSGELKEAVRRKWHDDGFSSESEWLEMLAAVAVFGYDHILSVQEERLKRVSFLSDMGETFSGLFKSVMGRGQAAKETHEQR